MKSPFADILSPGVLLNLAGERFFERGEDYYRRGAVHSLTEFEGILAARVIGTSEYRVKFQAEDDGRLRYSCSCPLGADGLFCKHCVAVGIAWLEEAVGERHPEDALAIYEKRIEPLIEQTNNAAYKAAYELLVRVRDLMQRLDRQAEFEEYLELLRAEYKRKRNFMKLLEQIEATSGQGTG